MPPGNPGLDVGRLEVPLSDNGKHLVGPSLRTLAKSFTGIRPVNALPGWVGHDFAVLWWRVGKYAPGARVCEDTLPDARQVRMESFPTLVGRHEPGHVDADQPSPLLGDEWTGTRDHRHSTDSIRMAGSQSKRMGATTADANHGHAIQLMRV